MVEALDTAGLPVGDFEAAYSQAIGDPALADLALQMEAKAQSYFGGLRLPERPTIYDYLLRSLRPQDIIATFNWDPLLEQALERFPRDCDDEAPCRAYLHGSVAMNQCDVCSRLFSWTTTCPRCGSSSSPQPLLYPVGTKDYAATPGLLEAWENLEVGLNNAYIVTIFGYSGPATDREAVRLFSERWHASRRATMGDIAFVNTCDKAAIEISWRDLVANRDDGRVHWDLYPNYAKTRLARYPRRSVEESFQRNFMMERWTPTPFPDCDHLDQLDDFYRRLLAAERDESGVTRVPMDIDGWPDAA